MYSLIGIIIVQTHWYHILAAFCVRVCDVYLSLMLIPFHYLCLGDAWKMLLDVAGAMMAEGDQESLISMTNFVDQLPSVLNQVLRYFF